MQTDVLPLTATDDSRMLEGSVVNSCVTGHLIGLMKLLQQHGVLQNIRFRCSFNMRREIPPEVHMKFYLLHVSLYLENYGRLDSVDFRTGTT